MRIRELTPFEIIRDEYFNVEIENNLRYEKADSDRITKVWLPQTIIKGKSIIHSEIPYQKRRYNEKSKENLIQYESEKEDFKELNQLKKIDEINEYKNVENWADTFLGEFKEKKGKEFSRISSKQTTEKIYRISSVFVRSVLSGFVSVRGFKQRSISFVTLTLTESQKHSDKKIIETFVDFIDHLKKVKNYLIDPVTKERTKEEGLKIENYVWRAETQENGNIHFHLIADVFLNQDMLRRVWNNYLEQLGYKYGYGAANVNSLKRDKKSNKIKNVENYLCKYMTKPPLRKKYKHYKRKDLIGIPDSEKYRRPVLGKTWGCSKKLLKLEYPKFYGQKAKEVFYKLKTKLKEYRNINIPEYIKIFTGNVREIFKQQTYQLQRQLKDHYLLCLQWLYDEIPLTI